MVGLALCSHAVCSEFAAPQLSACIGLTDHIAYMRLSSLLFLHLFSCTNAAAPLTWRMLLFLQVLTQYNSTSLNRHLSRSYQFLNNITFTGQGAGFVDVLAASQRPGKTTTDAWYQGTADAVRR